MLWLIITKVAGVKVYPRQTWNFRAHAVSACSNHVIGLWCHRLMHATQADACMYHIDKTYLYGMYCMHCRVTSKVDAWRYCMGSKVFKFVLDIPLLQLLWVNSKTFHRHFLDPVPAVSAWLELYTLGYDEASVLPLCYRNCPSFSTV